MSGAVALALIVTAASAQVDDLITSLPVSPRMETEVVALTTFDERRQSVLSKLEELKTQAIETRLSKPEGDR